MPISGLVLTLTEDEQAVRAALDALSQSAHIELGTREGRKQAVVLDTVAEQDNKAAWQWLTALPGVCHVDVVFVSLEHEQESSAETPGHCDCKGVTPCP